MKTKEKVTMSIDKTTIDAFRNQCDMKKEKYSRVVEYLMKLYLLYMEGEDSKELEFNKYLLKLIKEGEKNE